MNVAVLDVGKTNVKLSIASPAGEIIEAISTPNTAVAGPPYRHHDLKGIEAWLVDGLRRLAKRHAVGAIVTCAHGSGGVLIGEDRPIMPMIDYEQAVPEDVDRAYLAEAGSYRERASAIMLGASHLGRQMLWLEMRWPEAFAAATAFLPTPQYWAWRLSGVAAEEVTSLAAQSHIWASPDRRPATLVARRGWERLLPPLRPAWASLGRLKPEFAASIGLDAGTRVLCGIHDSSANFYRYQAAGLSDMTVVSTGTWIVALTDRAGMDFDVERSGHSCNADVFGNPMPGTLTMGGREFSAIADGAKGPAERRDIDRIVETRTFALPSFGPDDGLFPGTAGRGSLHGPLAEDGSIRFSLAVLYSALLTARCVAELPPARTVVLDGNFVVDPLYGALVARLLPERRVLVSRNTTGTATGAALLAGHETRREPAPIDLETPDIAALPDLSDYYARWRAAIGKPET